MGNSKSKNCEEIRAPKSIVQKKSYIVESLPIKSRFVQIYIVKKTFI